MELQTQRNIEKRGLRRKEKEERVCEKVGRGWEERDEKVGGEQREDQTAADDDDKEEKEEEENMGIGREVEDRKCGRQ